MEAEWFEEEVHLHQGARMDRNEDDTAGNLNYPRLHRYSVRHRLDRPLVDDYYPPKVSHTDLLLLRAIRYHHHLCGRIRKEEDHDVDDVADAKDAAADDVAAAAAALAAHRNAAAESDDDVGQDGEKKKTKVGGPTDDTVEADHVEDDRDDNTDQQDVVVVDRDHRRLHCSRVSNVREEGGRHQTRRPSRRQPPPQRLLETDYRRRDL